MAFAGRSAQAATKSWLGGTSSDWNTGANWQGGVPANGDDLIFTNSPTFQPSNNNIAGLAPNSLYFSNAVALSLGGNSITLGWPAAAQATTFGRVSGSTTATATNPAGHGLAVGQVFWSSGAGTPFDGVYQVASVLSATTFTFTVANSGGTAGSGTSGHASSLDNVNTAGGRDVTIANGLSIVNTQHWGSISSNGVTILSGNLTGSSNVVYVTADTRTAPPALRLAGTNSGFTGHFRFLVGNNTAGLMLIHPAAMTAGNIDLGNNDRNLWIQGGPGIGTYTFGVGGGTNAVGFRNAGLGGLKVAGGDVNWDPGNGGDYSTVGLTNARVRLSKSLVNTNTIYFGNSSSRLVLSTNGFAVGSSDSGNSVSPIFRMLSALGDDGSPRTFTLGEGGNSSTFLVELTRNATGGSLGGTTVVATLSSLAVTNMDQIFNGNLNLSAGVIVLGGVSWSDFAADRSSGNGTGANQWRVTGGGFAARGSALSIPNDSSGGLSASAFDANFALGSPVLATNGSYYANRAVTLDRDTTLTGQRTITLAPTGPSLSGVLTASVIHTISADLSGSGGLVLQTAVNGSQSADGEVVLSGANTWTGGATNHSLNTGIFMNSGPGGLNANGVFVRFDSDAALPTGNGGNPSFIGAVSRNVPEFTGGILLSGGSTERIYDLAAGYKFMIGGMSVSQVGGTFGASAGLSKLQNSTILVHDGAGSYTSGGLGIPMVLLVRDGGVLTLGDLVNGSVRFVASTGQSSVASATATQVDNVGSNRVFHKRGEGTLVLKNVAYTDIAETGDRATQFIWRVGRATGGNSGTAAYFDGAVRGLSPNDAGATDANSLKNFHIALRGGVYEIDNSGGGSGTFNRWVSINVNAATNISIGNVSGTTGIGGGGFSAFGGNVVVDLNTNGTRDVLTWALSSSGFLQSGDPLLLGSQTANATVEIFDTLNLNNGAREFRVIDNTNSVSDLAVISGTITGLSASAVNKTGDGALELRGTNTYAGGTTVSNGVLIVNTANGSATGTNTVSVSSGAQLGGAGVISGAVSVASGASVFMGTTTNQSIGHLRVAGGLTINSSVFRLDITNAAGTAGIDWDLLTVGGGSGTVTFNGSPSVTVVLRCTNATLPGFNPSVASSWLMIDAGSAVGFGSTTFTVQTNQFAPYADGNWTITQSSGDIFLNYTPNTPVDLSLAVTQSTSLSDVGTAMSYALTVSNIGPDVSASIVLSNTLGVSVTYVSSSDGGTAVGSGVIRWTLSPLAVGASTTVTLNVLSALNQGTFTNRAIVMMPTRADPNTTNNVTNLTAISQCPGAPAPTLNTVSRKTVFEFNNLTFNVVSSNNDCSTPFLEIGGKPAAATFTTVTNNYTRTGTFSWTPGSADVGTHTIRLYAWNANSTTSAFNMLIHVAQTGEPTNSAGVPLSQTNWHVIITNLNVPASGMVTVTWASVSGVTYDLYTSTNSLGKDTMIWNKEAANTEATSTQTLHAITNGTQRYLQVVPAGFTPSSNLNLWAAIKPTINPGYTLLSAPVSGTDLKINGAFGTNLAAVLTGHNGGTGDSVGDELFILNPDSTYSNLYLDASGVWRTSGGSIATHQLTPGQGLLVLRNTTNAAQPRFAGPVGNTLTRTNTITIGSANLLTFSEGKHLTPAQAFASLVTGTPVGDYDENSADQIIFVDPDGSFRPVQRLPDGTWLDLTTFTTATHLFTPGRAAFYIRQTTGGTMRARF